MLKTRPSDRRRADVIVAAGAEDGPHPGARGIVPFTLRLPGMLHYRLKIAVEKDPRQLSAQKWITEAIAEKIAREASREAQ